MSVIVFLGTVTGAEQVEPGDAITVAGVGVELLLNGEPAGTQPFRPEPEPPVQVQAAPDLADGGIDDLEVPGVAEPACELGGDRLGTGPLPEARGQQRAEPDVGGDRVTEPGEVLSARPSRNNPASANCGTAAGGPQLGAADVMDPLYGLGLRSRYWGIPLHESFT
jgi:hypothetical protein